MDEPVWFGRIAAANSLSDVYAMGGRPITALNLVMFPSRKLGTDILREILQGGHEKVTEAGACLAGGHSVDDLEPKYGLAVTGVVPAGRVLTNAGVQPGDVLIITKPLGTGVLFNARRSGKLPWAELEPVLHEVAALNRTAMEIALEFKVHSCTDITGFGLLGHSLEMAVGSGVRIDIRYAALPFYPNALDMYRKGETTGSNRANRELVRELLAVEAPLSKAQHELLFDPQTSGGLLLSVAAEDADAMIERMKAAGITAACRIGEAHPETRPGLRVL